MKLADCGICWLEGPDEFGMYDLIVQDECPYHGSGGEQPYCPCGAPDAESCQGCVL